MIIMSLSALFFVPLMVSDVKWATVDGILWTMIVHGHASGVFDSGLWKLGLGVLEMYTDFYRCVHRCVRWMDTVPYNVLLR